MPRKLLHDIPMAVYCTRAVQRNATGPKSSCTGLLFFPAPRAILGAAQLASRLAVLEKAIRHFEPFLLLS